MYGVRIKISFDELNEEIRKQVEPRYRSMTFIPQSVEINKEGSYIEVLLTSDDMPLIDQAKENKNG